jgi:uncharacterized cupredoxin-like copper-binding protein
MKSAYKIASLGVAALSIITLAGCTKAPETNTSTTATTETTTAPTTTPTETTLPPTGDFREVQVTLDEYSFTPENIEVGLGQQVQLTVTNTGALAHTFTAPDLGINLEVAGGKTESTIFSADKAGVFELTCTVAGHEQLGMTGQIFVSNL